jgi:DNA-binding CsgD family transcriptional regulator
MQIVKRYFPVFFFFFWFGALICQHTPAIVNYKVAEYKAHQQNWSISQAGSGLMYYANTDGLLSFNGNAWSLHKLKTNKIIRSVCTHGDRIYTGAYGEIGYWAKDDCGNLTYHSLLHLVKNNAIDKEEIWNIITVNGKIYFQSFSVLMVYDGEKIEKVELPGSIMFVHNVGGRLIIQALEYGLYQINENNRADLIPNTAIFKGKIVSGICAFPLEKNDHLLISTNSHGVYSYTSGKIEKWNPGLESYFAEIQINKMMVSQSGLLIIGSIRAGVLIFNSNGDLLYHVNSTNGLQNNTILSMFEDTKENVWLGMDKGIGLLKMKDKILLYHDHSGILGTVYTTSVHDSMLYVGTNQGLYYVDQRQKNVPGKDFSFALLKGTQGQVWQLKNLGSDLLCGHNEGTFIISKNKAVKISDITGGWYSEIIDNNHAATLLQGTYTGLAVLKKENNTWKLSHKPNGYNEPVKKFIVYRADDIWVTGPNTGLSRLRADAGLKNVTYVRKYGSKDGIMDEANLDINFLNGKILVNDGQFHYYFDEKSDRFIKDPYLNSFTPGYLIRIVDKRNWCRVYNDSLILMIDSVSVCTYKVGLNKDYHSVSKLTNDSFTFSLNEGYAICKTSDSKSDDQGIKIVSEKIVLSNSGTCVPVADGRIPDIAYSNNDLRIYFYDCVFEYGKTYRYRLIPVDNDWKATNDISFLEFSNLSPGSYTVEIMGEGAGPITTVSFVILPPFYKSRWAGLFYIILIGFGIYLSKKYFDKKLAQEKLKLEAENARLLREHKYQMENDKLMQDNIIKNKELANATMHLIQKNELLQEIKEELIDVRKTGDHTLTTKDFQNLMKLINENMNVEDDKNLFESSFNEVHEKFLTKLKSDFPELSAADLKLAAYLKMNLTSKEIAPLFNISIRGLENKRYRLRKKLHLPNDANLLDFFIGYS